MSPPALPDRLLLDHAGEMLLAVDPQDLMIVAANSKASQLLDYGVAELIGRPITELESSLADVFYWEGVRGGAAGEITNVEGLYRCRDGSLMPVTKDVRRTQADGRDWLVLRVRDERERQRGADVSAALASQLKATIEASSDGILVTDADGRMLNMNRRFGEMWGIPDAVLQAGDETIANWLAEQLTAPDSYRRGMTAAAQNQHGESFDVLALVGGRYFERRARPQMLDERIIGRVYSFHDISERVAYERELVEVRDRAEQASRAKSRFLATMSHELRTPMNGILGMAQLLLLPDLPESERLQYARTVIDSGRSLLALLNDILDLSKVEAGRLELAYETIDPAPMVADIATLFSGPAHAKGLAMTGTWHGPQGGRYRADPLRLRQILTNLASNAVKFTPTGSVLIEGTEIERWDGRARLEFAVTDSGIGVPQDKRELLFKPFSQVDSSTTRTYGGTGLGLSIVRSLAELMGGEAGVESVEGRGSRFWFRVCVDCLPGASVVDACTAATLESVAIEPMAPTARKVVLVVEDNVINRKVVETMLRRHGVEVRCVDNGRQALETIMAGEIPDLVFMDCQMPVMDGFEATEKIRAWESAQALRRLPIVALTAGVFKDDRQRCAAAGMDDFLDKPVDFKQLIATMTRWLTAIPADLPAAPQTLTKKSPAG